MKTEDKAFCELIEKKAQQQARAELIKEMVIKNDNLKDKHTFEYKVIKSFLLYWIRLKGGE